MSTLILDLEGNGLREDITKIHCIVGKHLESGIITRFSPLDLPICFESLSTYLSNFDLLVGHNIIGYDIPVMTKLLGIDFTNIKTFDTLVSSILLNPDRQLPVGCPAVTINPLTGKNDKIGPHSLEAHGFRLGERKIHHYDWQVFSKEMLDRCTSDVLITEKLYLEQRELLGV